MNSSLITTLGPSNFVNEFCQQFLAYAQQEFPFDNPIKDGNTLGWWESLKDVQHARALAVSAIMVFFLVLQVCWLEFLQYNAIKIFLVLVNSMPDERTGSNITWFNSLLQANQKVSTLVNMIQVGQWYRIHQVRSTQQSAFTVLIIHSQKPKSECKERRHPTVKFQDMHEELGLKTKSTATPKSPSAANTLSKSIVDDSEEGTEDEELSDKTKVNVPCEDIDFEIDKDIDLSAPVLQELLDPNAPVHAPQSPVPSLDAPVVQKDADRPVDWNF
jgi:hypothetical protein